MEKVFIMAGIGGQGMQMTGKILVKAANSVGKEIVFFPIYGGQKRGGVSSCYVIVSDEPIGAPVRERADYTLVMDPIGFERYKNAVVDGGWLVINSSMVSGEVEENKGGVSVVRLPFTDIALNEIKNSRVIGVLALGYLLGISGVLSKECVMEEMKKQFPSQKVLDVNVMALEYGLSYAHRHT